MSREYMPFSYIFLWMQIRRRIRRFEKQINSKLIKPEMKTRDGIPLTVNVLVRLFGWPFGRDIAFLTITSSAVREHEGEREVFP